MVSRRRRSGCLAAVLAILLLPRALPAAQWTRRYINALPDSAFAAIERTKDGKQLRHLPHHDRSGRVDVSHLRNALQRLPQVKWTDPHDAVAARAHLEQHLRQLRQPR